MEMQPGNDNVDFVEPLLAFWFIEHGRKNWFAIDAAYDRDFERRFGSAFASLKSAALQSNLKPTSARHALASVLLLDQYPRNVYRGSAAAFATDHAALALARHALERRLDTQLATVDEKLFLYLPFEHSERLADQNRSVELCQQLGDEEYTRFAQAHRAVIERFGRFPHRNAILGRPSTPAEIEFLQQPGSHF